MGITMGKKIVLTDTTLTGTAPRLAAVDGIESAGSLVLFDYAHPDTDIGAGVPAHLAVIPNLVAGNFATLSGVTGENLHGIFRLAGNINNGTLGKVERSGKGGIHVIVSQANPLEAGDGVAVNAPAALYTYLAANPTHDIYFSAWDRQTRADKVTGANSAFVYATSSSTSHGPFNVYNTNAFTPGGWAAVEPPGNAVGPRRTALTVTGYGGGAGSLPARSGLPLWGAPASTLNANTLATRNEGWPSFITYRVYIEDLTVSGRTHAEVDALDYALYAKDVLTAGGRYHGDTFTDPATLP